MTVALKDQEKIFVEAYCGECNFDLTKAREAAGYKDHSHRSRGLTLLNKPHIQEAIKARMDRRAAVSWFAEDDILRMLMKEATREDEKATHSARIQAILHLGKHIGMFQEKKVDQAENKGVQINVLNYSGGADKNIEALVEKNKQEVLEHLDEDPIEGLVIQNYSEEAPDGN